MRGRLETGPRLERGQEDALLALARDPETPELLAAAARNRAVSSRIGLACRVAVDTPHPHVEDDDAVGEALLTLVEAASSVDLGRAGYGTHAAWEIRGRLSRLDWLARPTLSRRRRLGLLAARRRELWEPAPEYQEPSGVEDLLSCLLPGDRAVVRLHYGFDGAPLPFSAIGAKLGVTKARVNARHKRALARLRQAIGAMP